MAEIKTKPTGASIEEYIASRANEEQAGDIKRLMTMLKKLTKKEPRMWGPSIVGYDVYRYTYESGHSGEMCVVGFAIRGRELVLYISADDPAQTALLAKLGKHKFGKSCLYFKRLADLDLEVLEQLIAQSIKQVKQRHGGNAAS